MDSLYDEEQEIYDEEQDIVEENTSVNEYIPNPAFNENINQPSIEQPAVSVQLKEEVVRETLSPTEYVSKRYEEFTSKYAGINSFDDEWKALRSQINASMKLNIPYDRITNFITYEYSYEIREVFKYALWSGISDETLELVKANAENKTWKEIMIEIDNSRLDKNIASVIDKPLDSMTQMLEIISNTVDRLSTESENTKKELEEKIESFTRENKELKEQLEDKEKAISRLIADTDEENQITKLTRQMNELKAQHEKENKEREEQEELRRQREEVEKMRENAEKDIQRNAENLAKTKFEEFKKDYIERENEIAKIKEDAAKKENDLKRSAEIREKNELRRKIEELTKENNELKRNNSLLLEQASSKKSFFKNSKKKITEPEPIIENNEVGTNPINSIPIDFNDNIEELPSDFDIGRYVISKNVSSDIINLINIGILNGCPDATLKQLLDSNMSAEQMRGVLEVHLAKLHIEKKKNMEEDDDIVGEDDITYV